MIAPQHGYVIAGERVPLFLDQLEQLCVGYDLLAVELDQLYDREYRELVALVIDEAVAVLGECMWTWLAETNGDGSGFAARAPRRSVAGPPLNLYACSAGLFRRLTHDKGPLLVNALRNRILRFCCEQQVPVPPIGWEMEGGQDIGVPRSGGPAAV